MSVRRMTISAFAVALIASLAATVSPGRASLASPAYTVTDLGTLGGRLCAGFTGANSFGAALNNLGQAAGGSCKFVGFFQPVISAFAWRDGAITDLGVSGAAYGMNDAGAVVGGTGNPDFESSGTAFLSTAGSLTSLAPILGGFSRAFDINNSGQIVGLRGTSPAIDRWRSFLYDPRSGAVLDLGTLGGTFRSTATAINERGQVAGWASLPNENTFHAYLWSSGSMTDLGTLGGSHSFANGLNAFGHVVGDSWVAGGNSHAFLWRGDSMIDLGTLGGNFSVAWAINDSGRVVGSAGTPTAGVAHAFVWADGVMRDLNDLVSADSGWILRDARAINDGGQIVGTGRFGGEDRAFLLTPTAVDDTPPNLALPAAIAADATSPDGAVVTYSATALDDVDGPVAATCSPASGSTFPIGDTIVTCGARDAAGNTSTASFDVHVKGASEQLDDLKVLVPGPGTSLPDKITAIQAALAVGDLSEVCGTLGAFDRQVEAQSGKSISTSIAGELLATTARIGDVLAC